MTTTYTVEGMTCGHCAASVKEELMAVNGVQDVSVEVQAGRVEVRSEAPLERESVASAISEAGYTLVAE